jgi:signal peptidase I
MSGDRFLRWSRRVLIATALVGWFLVLRPQLLGGPAAYVMVVGTSMQPALQPGDLVVALNAGTYGPGDVVAYRVPDGDPAAGRNVIHRIIGGSALEGYILQGDNTDGSDLWRPRGGDLLGRQWLVLPRVGSLLMILQSPAALAAFAAALAVILLPIWKKPHPVRPAGASHTLAEQVED